MFGSLSPFWQVFALLSAYSAAVILASVIGGLLPEWIRLTHIKMQVMLSFVGGIMLGIAVFHMIPHALVAANGDIDVVAKGLMLGLVATFFLLRFSHFHQHGPADFGIYAQEMGESGKSPTDDGHTHICSDHNHPATHQHGHEQGATRWIAVLVGLGVHTLMDGVAMASGVVSESAHAHGPWLPGFGIFLAVLLHKPLDAVSITSLMHPVTTPSRRLVVNIGFALMCPIGAFLFWAGASQGPAWTSHFAAWGLAFSAGVFLCISLSDLLPEMEFHSHGRVLLSAALLAGILAAAAIGFLEGEHAHSHSRGEDDHAGHNHADHDSDSKTSVETDRASDHSGHSH